VEHKQLAAMARQGDKEALVHLIMAQHRQYYQLAYVYMKNQHDVLDAIQDMIVALYENIHRLKNAESFSTWSKVILVNCCKNLLRKKQKIVPLDNIQEEKDSWLEVGKQEEMILLEGLMSKLSNKQREVVNLRYALDLDYQTIAEILKIPLGTVKSRIFSSLKQMKESMGGELDD